jgi:hypothetical protein
LPKSDLKFLKIKIKWFQLPEVRKYSKFMISITDLPCVAKKYRWMIKDFYFIFGLQPALPKAP